MRKIETKKAPGAIGPYSQAFETNGFVITSGQIPVDPQTGLLPEAIDNHAHHSTTHAADNLEPAATSLEKVVKTTCFLADMKDFAAFNEVYAAYFTSYPARSCVAVKDLPKGAACEIEAIAEK